MNCRTYSALWGIGVDNDQATWGYIDCTGSRLLKAEQLVDPNEKE